MTDKGVRDTATDATGVDDRHSRGTGAGGADSGGNREGGAQRVGASLHVVDQRDAQDEISAPRRLSARQAWTRFIVSTLATAILASVLSLCLWAALPAAIGWHPTTVSSGSMLPRLAVGDIAVSRPIPASKLHLGQVLLYNDPDQPDRLRMHRFVEVGENGAMITKGDNNPSRDSSTITPDAVLGVGFLRVPYIGLPIVWLREGRWVAVGVTAAIMMGLIYLSTVGSGLDDDSVESARDETDDEAGPPDPDDRDSAERSIGSDARGTEASGTDPRGSTARDLSPAAGRATLEVPDQVPVQDRAAGSGGQ